MGSKGASMGSIWLGKCIPVCFYVHIIILKAATANASLEIVVWAKTEKLQNAGPEAGQFDVQASFVRQVAGQIERSG